MKYFKYQTKQFELADNADRLIQVYGYTFQASIPQLCQSLRLSRLTVVRRIKWLQENGYLTISKGGHNKGNVYKLNKVRINHFTEKAYTARAMRK